MSIHLKTKLRLTDWKQFFIVEDAFFCQNDWLAQVTFKIIGHLPAIFHTFSFYKRHIYTYIYLANATYSFVYKIILSVALQNAPHLKYCIFLTRKIYSDIEQSKQHDLKIKCRLQKLYQPFNIQFISASFFLLLMVSWYKNGFWKKQLKM